MLEILAWDVFEQNQEKPTYWPKTNILFVIALSMFAAMNDIKLATFVTMY